MEHDPNEISGVQTDDRLIEHDCPILHNQPSHTQRFEQVDPCPHITTTDHSTILQDIRKSAKYLLSGNNLLAFLSVCGSVRLTVDLYDHQRVLMQWLGDEVGMPAYKTVSNVIFNHVLTNCFAVGNVVSLPLKQKEIRPRSRHYSEHGGCGQQPAEQSPSREAAVRVIFPSEWAKMDIVMFPFYDNMISPYHEGDIEVTKNKKQNELDIERTAIVRNREKITNADEYIYATRSGFLELCCTGTVVTVHAGNFPPLLKSDDLQDMGYRVESNTSALSSHASVAITGRVGVVWCVGAKNSHILGCTAAPLTPTATDSADIIRLLNGSMDNERGLSRHLVSPRMRGRRRFFTDITTTAYVVLKGDICAIIDPVPKGSDDALRCVLVYRFRRFANGEPSQFILWLEKENDQPRVTARQSMFGIPTVEKHCNSDLELETPRNIPGAHVAMGNFGKLEDGTTFFVYRILFYSDDFKPSSSLLPTGSVGGCYLLPLGLSPKWRSSRAGVRIISLNPPGLSTNLILHHIIPDIVKSGSSGVDAVTPTGEHIKVFVDVVGFIADYPAAAETLDVMGHTADSPCTHCSIRKLKSQNSSELAYTSIIHARNPAFLRCAGRNEALRTGNLIDADARKLGMIQSSQVTD